MSPENDDVEVVDDENEEEEFVAVEDEDELQEDDERLAHAEDDEDVDDKRARRRTENKTRRQRQKEARERTERELNFLRTRNEQLEQRFSQFEVETDARIAGSELQTVQQGISKAKADLALANQVISQAVEQQSGADLAEAMDHRDTIRDNLRELEQAEEYLSTPRRRAPAPQRELDPRHVAHAQSFMMDNDWWDPQGRDPDSRTVLEIDRQLVVDGFDPTQKEYWDELRARTEDALPSRFDSRSGHQGGDDTGGGNNNAAPRNRGPAFRTGGQERPLKKNEVYISPERKEAMIEAGVWEDPKLRNKYLKSYADYDRRAAEGA